MSLEKWLKPDKKVKKSEDKQRKTEVKINLDSTIKLNSELDIPKSITVTKFKLECPKSTCKYKKTIIKKCLADKDKICPRCKTIMKIK